MNLSCFALHIHNEMVTCNLNNARKAIAVHHARISEEMLIDAPANSTQYMITYPKHREQTKYAVICTWPILLTEVTWLDFNDQFHMTWFQWPISNHWILVTSVTWPDFNDKCHMAWFLWPWPCFWLSLYRKVWRGSWWSLSDSCSREPDFFHFCINHIPENKYPHLVNSVSDFYTILSFSCSQIDFGHPTNKRIIRISYLWKTV